VDRLGRQLIALQPGGRQQQRRHTETQNVKRSWRIERAETLE